MNKFTFLQLIAVFLVTAAFAVCLSNAPSPIETSGIATRENSSTEKTPVLLSFLDKFSPDATQSTDEIAIAGKAIAAR